MSLHDFIGLYLTLALVFGVIFFIILIVLKVFNKNDNPWWSIIITTLTAIAWPILIVYLIYLSIQENELDSKNKKTYQKYRGMIQEWNVPIEVKSNAFMLLNNLYASPDRIFPTGRNSIQFEWDLKDGSYMEFEIYKNEVSCLIVPFHETFAANKQYDKIKEVAIHKHFILMDIESIDNTVKDFIDGVYSQHAKASIGSK